jgi:glycosyltransferase involved in cell wall biosynthesis
MRIAVIVPGRFHAFDLVRALIKRGNEVVVFSNYPRWAVARFGIPPGHVRSFPLHGILSRLIARTWWKGRVSTEAWLHSMFARWAARQLRNEHWDVIHAWSGVSEEIYADKAFVGPLKLVMRGSAHIQTQARLLAEEQVRVGAAVDHPSQWMIEREQREYPLADRVVVLSTFAYDSFRAHGIAASKLRLLSLGTDTRAFRPTPAVIEARRRRILSGEKLRVLFVGGISWRKGLADLREIFERGSGRYRFRVVGAVWEEAKAAVAALAGRAEFIGKRPQRELPAEYAWGDVFIFPTVEDGYAVVLAQASAAGLPVLTTCNCSGPDLIIEGRTGWVLPIRDPEAFLARLEWCDTHRQELADLVTTSYTEFRTRDWADVAADFEVLCAEEARDPQ